MYKILLVDDEEIIRNGISSFIAWENYGFTLIGTADNGMEAYDKALRERPDVIMTDLKMPALDGLGLIAKITQQDLPIEFIILSGYGEFALAREAMHYGIRYYLLKPCNEQEIIEVLGEIKQELDKWKMKTEDASGERAYPTTNRLVRTIIDYIDNNTANEDLSLKWLASKLVFVNVGYLSKLFLKETGERFSHYLMRVRMEKAKSLFRTGRDNRVCEIARSVGLGDNPQYFSHLFKRFTGSTPSEYKKED